MPINSSSFYCPAVNGIAWTLFREKCYYRYSSPFGMSGISSEAYNEHYKTWFEAREKCAKVGAKLASVHDQATHERLLQLIDGNETVTNPKETIWIGLQVGKPHNVTHFNQKRAVYETGCWWPADVCPRLMEDDPDPKNTADKCSVTYNATFRGRWEDGKLYDKAESKNFWAPGEPSDRSGESCKGEGFNVDEQSQAYCERGPNGQPDQRRHCAQILPADAKQIEDEDGKPFAGKWMVYWCWIKSRGYICEHPVKRVDRSGDGTAPTFTTGGVETQTSATLTSCGSRLDECTKRARRRAKEIERKIDATRTGYNEVINTMVLGGSAPGATWLGTASFEHLARSAIDFGRNLAKLSAEECVPHLRGLQSQLQALSKNVEGSYKKTDADLHENTGKLRGIVRNAAFLNSDLKYRQEIRSTLKTIYLQAGRTLKQGNDTRKEYFRGTVMRYCESDNQAPEVTIMKMIPYFVSSAPEGETFEDSGLSFVFNALAYLPYDREEQQCRLPKNKFVDVGYRNLNFFVIYANGTRNAERACKGAKSNKNLCERLEAALSDRKISSKAFGGIAAVRCGYEFVWYELGYTYFYAAESSTDYKWEKKGGAYDAECGQIFFFP